MLLLQPTQRLGILMVGLRLINMQLSVLAARRPADLRLTHLRHVYAHCDNFLIVLEVVNITAGLGRMGRKSTFVMWIGKRMVHLETGPTYFGGDFAQVQKYFGSGQIALVRCRYQQPRESMLAIVKNGGYKCPLPSNWQKK